MADKRSYGDSCGIARALDLVGERWSLLVVRELVLGPKRFTDLRAGLSGCSPDMLAQRLRDLEQAGVVRRRKLPPPRQRPGLRADRVGPRARAGAAGAGPLGQPLAAADRAARRWASTRWRWRSRRCSTRREPAVGDDDLPAAARRAGVRGADRRRRPRAVAGTRRRAGGDPGDRPGDVGGAAVARASRRTRRWRRARCASRAPERAASRFLRLFPPTAPDRRRPPDRLGSRAG